MPVLNALLLWPLHQGRVRNFKRLQILATLEVTHKPRGKYKKVWEIFFAQNKNATCRSLRYK
jgi:hypothetical protein